MKEYWRVMVVKKINMLIVMLIIVTFALCSCDYNEYLESIGLIKRQIVETEKPNQKSSDSQSNFSEIEPQTTVSDNTHKQQIELQSQNNADVVQPVVNVKVFYQLNDKTVVPVTRKIAKQEGIARAVLAGMIDNSISREELAYFGLYPILPEGTQILGLTIRDKEAKIDFNSGVLRYKDKKDEINIITSVAYALMQFPTVDRVRVLIEGKQVPKLRYGCDISEPLNRNNVMINSDRIVCSQGNIKYDVYYFKTAQNRCYLLPVSFETKPADESLLLKQCIDSLCLKAVKNDMYTEFPEGSRVLGVSIDGSKATINMNEYFIKYGGTSREQGILSQIEHTVGQFPEIATVYLKVNSKQCEMPEGSDISKGLKITGKINQMME